MSRGQMAKYRLSRLKNNAQLADSFFAPFCLSETRVLLLAGRVLVLLPVQPACENGHTATGIQSINWALGFPLHRRSS